MHYYCEGEFSGSVSFENNSGTIHVLTKTATNIPINYSGTGTRAMSARISGAYNGVTPSKSINYGLPARPAAPPDPVGTPSVSNITTDGATASWSAPDNNGAGIDRYAVLWETAAGLDVHYDETGSRSHRTSGRAPGGDYSVRVKAHNSAGWGNYGNARSFTTDIAVPAAVFGRATSNITSSSVRFSWESPNAGGGDIDHYELVYRRAVDTATTSVIDDNGSPRDVTGLQPGTDYVWNIRAHNEAGYGPYNTSGSFTTLAAPPAAPVQGAPSALDHQSIKQTWSTPSDNGGAAVSNYDFQLALDAGFTTGVQTVSDMNVLTHTWTGLASDTAYFLRVRAENSAGQGAWSATKTATTDPAPITDPSLAPQVTSKTAVSATLKGVAGTATREFQIATNSGFTTGVVTQTVTTVSSQFNGLKPGGAYWGRYRINSGSGYGAYSPGVAFTLPKRPVRWNGTAWADDLSFWGEAEWGPALSHKRWTGAVWL